MNLTKKWIGFPSPHSPKIWIDNSSSIACALNLYHPYSKIGVLVKKSIEVLPNSIAQRIFSGQPDKADREFLDKRTDYIKTIMRLPDLTVSFSTGTPGVHRKVTAQVSDSDNILSYVKIGGESVKMLLENEAHVLEAIKKFDISRVEFPEIIDFSGNDNEHYLFQTAPKEVGGQRNADIDSADVNFLTALSTYGRQTISLAKLFSEHGYLTRLDCLQSSGNYRNLWRHAEEIIELQLGERGVYCAYSHGDYAPWNTLSLTNGDLYVFDWEYGREVAPVLIDCMHRIFMPARLVANKGAYQCIQLLLSIWEKEITSLFIDNLGISKDQATAYILLYLIDLAGREYESEQGVSDFVIECVVHTLGIAGHSKHQKKVLVSAYACEPDQGSEPGVGWHWVEEISRDNDAWVLTKKNNRESIERQLKRSPNCNLHFEYVDVPKWASFWKKKQRGVRTYYYLWQFAALFKARKLNQSVVFDLGHHVTFVNDWLWTFFALMPLPFIWGPIGSHPKAPAALLPDDNSRKFDRLRFSFQVMMRCIDPLYWLSMIRANKILAINEQTANTFPLGLFAKNKTEVYPAIAVEEFSNNTVTNKKNDRFNVLFVGRFIPIKGAHLAIDAFAIFVHKNPNAIFTLVGKGPDLKMLQSKVNQLGLKDSVEFVDWLPRDKAISRMSQSDVFLFPSMEGAGMVVLEAMALGTPVVCLDFGGPAAVVDTCCGIKVSVKSQQETIDGLAVALNKLFDDSLLRARLSSGAIKKVQTEMLWLSKSKLCNHVYTKLK